MPIFLTVMMTIFSSQLIADIYSWKDENGVTHFSESKPASALADFTMISMDEKPATMRINPEDKSEQVDGSDSSLTVSEKINFENKVDDKKIQKSNNLLDPIAEIKLSATTTNTGKTEPIQGN